MIEHLSYSSISAYLSCGKWWKFKYIEKQPTPASAALFFGSAWHGAIERLITAESADPQTAWQAAWNAQKERDPDLDWGSDSPEEHFNTGLRMIMHPDIQTGILSIKAGKDELGWKIERKIELRVPAVPVPVIGYIDMIGVDGVPADFKTSASRWSDDKALGSAQSLFYLAGMNQAGLQTPAWRFRHYIFVKTKTPQFQCIEHSHQPGELLWLFEVIQNVWRGIEAGIFTPNPDAWRCKPQSCEFWAQCRGRV
jgi:hypothetical protein